MTVGRTRSLAAGMALTLAAGAALGAAASGARPQSAGGQMLGSNWHVTATRELKGITRLAVTINGPGTGAGACGWPQDGLRHAAESALTAGSIAVVDANSSNADAGVATLTVDGVARALSESSCIGYLSVDITDLATPVVPSYGQDANTFVSDGHAVGPYALIEGDPPGSPTRNLRVTLGDVRLLAKGGMLSGAPAAFSQGLQDQVGRIVAGFVSEIKQANQG